MFPDTSRRLLLALQGGRDSSRWEEFVVRYEPGLRDYAARHFPTLDGDDLVQETFLAFIRRLPDFVYAPEATGAFHAYLVGILRLTAFATYRKQAREQRRLQQLEQFTPPPAATHAEDAAWRESAYELVLHQFFSDPRVHDQTKRIFRRVALDGESPETVARDYALTRNAVDQIKRRCLLRLQAEAAKLVKG